MKEKSFNKKPINFNKFKKYAIYISLFLLVCLLVFYFFFDDRFDTVVAGKIYRSAQLSDDDFERYIQEKGIKTILNLRGKNNDEEWYQEEKKIALGHNVQLYDLRLSPKHLPDIDKLTRLLDILLNCEKPLLIHCRKGADRTGFVSALALAIEKDPPLRAIKEQFSMRYGVFPFYKSIGPYFFENYEKWLKKKNIKHSKNSLLYWIENDYIDRKGNLIYWIDTINDKPFDDNRRLFINDNKDELLIKGWTFDYRTKSSVKGLYIHLDNDIQSKAIYKYNRPGVARYFKFGEKYYKDFPVGWEASFKKESIPNGCHDINLKFVMNTSSIFTIPTRFTFCLK